MAHALPREELLELGDAAAPPGGALAEGRQGLGRQVQGLGVAVDAEQAHAGEVLEDRAGVSAGADGSVDHPTGVHRPVRLRRLGRREGLEDRAHEHGFVLPPALVLHQDPPKVLHLLPDSGQPSPGGPSSPHSTTSRLSNSASWDSLKASHAA